MRRERKLNRGARGKRPTTSRVTSLQRPDLEHRDLAAKILNGLHVQGAILLTEGAGASLVYKGQRYPLDHKDAELGTLLHRLAGVNVRERSGSTLVGEFVFAARHHGIEPTPARWTSVINRKIPEIAIVTTKAKAIVVQPGEVHEVVNGSQGWFLPPGELAKEWRFEANVNEQAIVVGLTKLKELVVNRLAMDRADAWMLVACCIGTLLKDFCETRPLLVARGGPGTGKTIGCRLIGRFSLA